MQRSLSEGTAPGRDHIVSKIDVFVAGTLSQFGDDNCLAVCVDGAFVRLREGIGLTPGMIRNLCVWLVAQHALILEAGTDIHFGVLLDTTQHSGKGG